MSAESRGEDATSPAGADHGNVEAAAQELVWIRQRLADVDRQLFDLILARARLAGRAGLAKRSAGLPIFYPERERQVLVIAGARARAAGLPETNVSEIFRHLVEIARKAQEHLP